jgi:Domain of unknown function (DUF4286)
MLIINTTYQVSESCEKEWKEWVCTEYIPEVIAPGLLIQPRFHRLLIENESGNQSYSLQFQVQDLETLEDWFQNHGSKMQKNLSDRFQEKILGFTTVMEVIEFE